MDLRAGVTGSRCASDSSVVRTLRRVLVCFVVLPLLPVAAVLLLFAAGFDLQGDAQKGVFVCVGVACALISGALGYRPRRSGAAVLGYAVTTGALSVISFGVLVVLLVVVVCADAACS